MRLLSSIIARIALGPLLLVLVSGLSLLIYDVHNETSLRQVIARHDQSARLKDVIQQAIGDMAAAQQSASEYLPPSDAGLADTMRAEVTQFLKAMASNDDDERRQYERISGMACRL
jgi:hypothetical protein